MRVDLVNLIDAHVLNVESTIMLVMPCSRNSCLVINCYLQLAARYHTSKFLLPLI